MWWRTTWGRTVWCYLSKVNVNRSRSLTKWHIEIPPLTASFSSRSALGQAEESWRWRTFERSLWSCLFYSHHMPRRFYYKWGKASDNNDADYSYFHSFCYITVYWSHYYIITGFYCRFFIIKNIWNRICDIPLNQTQILAWNPYQLDHFVSQIRSGCRLLLVKESRELSCELYDIAFL